MSYMLLSVGLLPYLRYLCFIMGIKKMPEGEDGRLTAFFFPPRSLLLPLLSVVTAKRQKKKKPTPQ